MPDHNHTGLALSIKQPWADQIIYGVKKIEHRSRETRIRGTVYVYATKRPEPGGDFSRLPLGFIIGTIEIYDCRQDRAAGYKWLLRSPVAYENPASYDGGVPQPSFWRPGTVYWSVS